MSGMVSAPRAVVICLEPGWCGTVVRLRAEPVSGKVRYQIARDGLRQRLASGLQFVAKTPDVFFVDGLRVRQGI